MNNEPLSPAPARRATLIWLIIAQILAVLTLVPWLYVAALGALELQSSDSAASRGLPIAVLLYPILPIACSIAAWRWYRAGRNTAAALAMPLPIVVVLVGLYLLFKDVSLSCLGGACV